MFKKLVLIVAVVLLVGLLLIQLVPYGRDHNNPPVASQPQWDSEVTRELVVAACYDCHSNETVWPWYSNVAPMSWLVQRDVEEGRQVLNFSRWGQGEQEADDIAEVILEGEMPPAQYVVLHPSARLDEAEKQQLLDGLRRSLGAGFEGEEGEEDDD